ncbi:hypothetical protein B0T22DRAFT_369114 [Podospora appendiculata]|uniref:Ankyrin repeat protein n=1 Tax=Podospora appendiculata TaxID=314037 RepID=A0AAE0XL01_9PEZI|nr:hypothetical protein B0T22DRAFT_369114 [Podospora appendiculata]
MPPNTSSTPLAPVPLPELVEYIGNHPETPLGELIEPYRDHEAHLRQVFAQDPDNELLEDPYVNVLPVFTEHTPSIKVRARHLDNESDEEKSRYIMPLPHNLRRPNGSPAVVQTFKEFQHNFNVFSESALLDLNWSNVVASGSAVVSCLLPVPQQYNGSKRGLREFYHEKFAPASDVDLFLYGLTEEEAIEKIKDIETRVRDALLTETTTVRTKHAVTICSQYPTRHIQIVLRIYKSVSEIVTGFDIDCSGAAYDGKQVYCTPRALQAYMTQINHIDLSRRSPSYESRLSKYSHRGFEVYWSGLDRSRVDPTIFERSFQRTLGLARLLVLERLPTVAARDSYLDKRRQERGRPRIDRHYRGFRSLGGNIKEFHEDEIADWVNEEEVSNYHTFTIPYGEKFHAKKIEKLCYTRDLLLNAEWNQPEDRKVYLHRHPAFFGRFDDVAKDCCGYCPVAVTEEEKEVAEAEAKIYVSGKISFMKDDPGRQSIGSFHPLNDDDWTEMAYVGNSARLCQAIVDQDVEHVEDWLAQEGADPNSRDHTGRTPLHLAVMNSTPEIVRRLIDAGARLVSRLADGRTALHLAAARGNVEILKLLMEKSIANEAEYEEKKDQQRQERSPGHEQRVEAKKDEDEDDEDNDMDVDEESDGEEVDDDDSDDEIQSMATGSFVKVGREKADAKQDELVPEEGDEEPDFFDVNVIAWDTPCSALHFAILEGHDEVVKALCQEYGADVLLPVKFLDQKKNPKGALLTLVLALALPVEKAKSMAQTLLSLGASSAQADLNGITAFHRYVEQNAESLLQTLWELDATGTKTAINHMVFPAYGKSETPLQIAIKNGNLSLVLKLLENGAIAPEVDFETWLKSAKQSRISQQLRSFEENQKQFQTGVEQPLIMALQSPNPATALELLERGAGPNVYTAETMRYMQNSYSSNWKGETALDLVKKGLEALRAFGGETGDVSKPSLPPGIETYLENFEEGTYQHWVVSNDIEKARGCYAAMLKEYQDKQVHMSALEGFPEKMAAISETLTTLEKVEQAIISSGGKTFAELNPDLKADGNFAGHIYPRFGMQADYSSIPYQYDFSFGAVRDVTAARKVAYVKLFEAAWSGDLETIKTLTLTSWDNDKLEPPLKIAVHANAAFNGHFGVGGDNQNNPFSVAFLRGHHAAARGILEIAQAQYTPEEKLKARYRMVTVEEAQEDTDVDEDGSVDSNEDSGPKIFPEIVDAQFTIENIGQVSMQVNSHTKPQEMIAWQCTGFDSNGNQRSIANLLTYSISKKDLEGLRFLLDVYEHFGAQMLESGGEAARFYTFQDHEFQKIIRTGSPEILAEIIRRTGAGLPLQHLVEDSGVELQEKPKYYQGLTVYGKKRKDWAEAGRETIVKPTGSTTSPLLIAAMSGRLENVEWFLSNIPLRHYINFTKTKAAREDERIRHLGQSPGGLDGTISGWLNDRRELILHAAVRISDKRKRNELISYILKTCPQLSVNIKASNDATPLMLACLLGRDDAVKALVDAGADQTTKDNTWDNLLHAALYWTPSAEKLRALLNLLNPSLLATMLKERNKLSHAGRTPLHQWLAAVAASKDAYPTIEEALKVLNVLIEISPEAASRALWMLDGAGDTALHTLVSVNAHPDLIRAIVAFVPGLLSCENAVGRTPAEVAHDSFIASRVSEPNDNLYGWHQQVDPVTKLLAALPTTFVKKDDTGAKLEHEDQTDIAKTWYLCAELLREQAGAELLSTKRRLVSLSEANDVAKRLGEMQASKRYNFRLSTPSEDGGDGEKTIKKPSGTRSDFVSEQYYGAYFDPWDKYAAGNQAGLNTWCRRCSKVHLSVPDVE